ncbi:uncharacterized protein LOC110821774 [Carica papaya]|uniref:uncharacterized protein LOC110821774 n=1 Tax=Carica papaya TaxID=3649 RepID=UPI000B8C7130|nr:uncharacterized protein LOC110821774 [Carica papaya]
MGNCLTRNNRVIAEDDDAHDHGHNKARHDKQETITEQQALTEAGGDEKKMVAFKLRQEENANGASIFDNGVVRVRIVMTREELKQILSCSRKEEEQEESCTVERLLSELKRLREHEKISDGERTINEGFINGGWRPTLESIPEECQLGVCEIR